MIGDNKEELPVTGEIEEALEEEGEEAVEADESTDKYCC